jgi:hypothetical protein
MPKIESVSPEIWAQCLQIVPDTLNSIAKPTDRNLQKQAVERLYEIAGHKAPMIFYADSPLQANLMLAVIKSGDNLGDNLWDNLGDNLWDNLELWYYKARLGWLRGGELCGINYDASKWADYNLIIGSLDVIVPFGELCIVSAHPTVCHWSNTGQGIHCDNAPAVEWSDGYKLWAIEGYLVPESLVMEPEKQTLADINGEENAEIKRIRINRYGWQRYLTESNATILDTVLSGHAWETLMQCDGFKVLCTYDPSTGRPYALEVDESCQTCEQAQRYLLAPDVIAEALGLNPGKIKTYSLVRT